MKRISFVCVFALFSFFLFTATSCNKVKEAIASNINDISWTQSNITLTIPASGNLNAQAASGSVQFNLNDYIKSHGGDALGDAWSYVKHIYVTSLSADLQNADASNNFSNFDYSSGNAPSLTFATTANAANAVQLGGAWSQPVAPYSHVDIPVASNIDIKPTADGNNWVYTVSYKLSKPLTHDLQVNVTANYNISFKN